MGHRAICLPWGIGLLPLEIVEVNLFNPILAAPLDTVVTRGEAARRRVGSSSVVNANGPRKFVPNCNSNPSCVVRRCGTDITPALLTNRSSFASLLSFAANARTDRRLARSNTSARTLAGEVRAEPAQPRHVLSPRTGLRESPRCPLEPTPARYASRSRCSLPSPPPAFQLAWNFPDSPCCRFHFSVSFSLMCAYLLIY
jgi:hypothetical protein